MRTVSLESEELVAGLLRLPDTSYVSILDSCSYKPGRYLIAGLSPFYRLEARENNVIEYFIGGKRKEKRGDPLEILFKRITCFSSKKFIAIGFFSYDLLREKERLKDPLKIPDLYFSFYDNFIIYDYLYKTAIPFGDAVEEVISSREKPPFSGVLNGREVKSNFTYKEYINAVKRIKSYISAGDVYQVNLTVRFEFPVHEGEKEYIFLRLRENRAPFSAFIKSPEFTILSASPELFLRVRGRNIIASLIKGTVRKDGTLMDSKKRLLQSKKDLAEHVMIVDLMRNDIGKVSEYGSVRVKELFRIQELPNLLHLVSTVEGVFKNGLTPVELIRGAFPSGSITGAPKIRAMEIIDEVEGLSRSIFMGSIGYISWKGDMDLNVAIRTLLIKGRYGYINLGGGIVTDSQPEQEYRELLLKGENIFKILNIRLDPLLFKG